MKQYLLRYGEIGTKSPQIRQNFEDILIQNIERLFLKEGAEVIIEKERGRIFAFAEKKYSYLFSRVFGLVSFSLVVQTTSSLQDIKNESKNFAKKFEGTFAVRARRTGDHPYSSQDVASEVGSVLINEKPKLEVDLDEPDHELYIEIRYSDAYLFTEKINAPGGLPLSSQGKVVTYIEDKNDFVSTWLIMRRGARAYVFHAPGSKWLDELNIWDPNLKILGEGTLKDLLDKQLPDHIRALVVGHSLGDFRKLHHELPVFYPLIGFKDERINVTLKKIFDLKKSK